MQLDLLYLKYFLIYSWLKSPTHMRKFLETVINIIVGQICEKIVHFMIKAWNFVHGQISSYQNFWGSVPSLKCTSTAAILNFKMATYFRVMPVKLGIILQ